VIAVVVAVERSEDGVEPGFMHAVVIVQCSERECTGCSVTEDERLDERVVRSTGTA
jgi:hypothetical protein